MSFATVGELHTASHRRQWRNVSAGVRLRSVTVDDVEDCFKEIHNGRNPIFEVTNGGGAAQAQRPKHRPH